MAEYIEREAAINIIEEDKVEITPMLLAIGGTYTAEQAFDGINQTCDRHVEFLKELPAADVRPLKHGSWDYIMPVDGLERNYYCCSECQMGALLDYWGDDVKSPFCPTCGACMDKEGKKYWEEYDGELRLAE